MKKQIKIKISYAFDNGRQRGLGIGICEGRYGGSYLSGLFSHRPVFFRGADSCMVVMCRGETKNAGGKNAGGSEPLIRLMKRFQNWFQNDLPQSLSPLDADVVKCFWQEFIGDVVSADSEPPDVAVLLIHDGHYLFLNMGKITVYEYRHSEEKGKRWPTGHERKQLDRELGIPEAERQNIYFKYRRISKRSILLIVPDQIQTINPDQIRKKRKSGKWLQTFSQSAGAAVVIRYREG